MILKFRMNLAPIMFLILGVASFSQAQMQADAERIDTIPAIKVTNTQGLGGKYIHAIYAIGRHGFLNASPVPYLFTIRVTYTHQVTGNDVEFPTVQLDKKPFRGSYNMIVLTLSDRPDVTWANPDANVLTDYSILGIIDKPAMDHFISQSGTGAVYTFEL